MMVICIIVSQYDIPLKMWYQILSKKIATCKGKRKRERERERERENLKQWGIPDKLKISVCVETSMSQQGLIAFFLFVLIQYVTFQNYKIDQIFNKGN